MKNDIVEGNESGFLERRAVIVLENFINHGFVFAHGVGGCALHFSWFSSVLEFIF